MAENGTGVIPPHMKSYLSSNDTLPETLVDSRYNKHLETEYQDIELLERGRKLSNAQWECFGVSCLFVLAAQNQNNYIEIILIKSLLGQLVLAFG